MLFFDVDDSKLINIVRPQNFLTQRFLVLLFKISSTVTLLNGVGGQKRSFLTMCSSLVVARVFLKMSHDLGLELLVIMSPFHLEFGN